MYIETLKQAAGHPVVNNNDTSAMTTTEPSHSAILYYTAIAVRLALFKLAPSLSAILGSRVEVSTPITSFKRRRKPTWTHDYMTALMNLDSTRGPLSIPPRYQPI